MPAIVGAVKINFLLESAMFQVGDYVWSSPKSEAAIFSGPGSFNVRNGLRTINRRSRMNFYSSPLHREESVLVGLKPIR
ncbi:spore gernimation protein GerPA [Pueribacillus theae]|uniref:Spore gernimation protein GerPA n=1 Tax=Pueribacillus theae TaxID=2171751 RepID=A0A2U1JV08_9BACI|nr:spore germination protein [Pueribacillus theae]PWA09037.1 spore gernimation protein GerPA [Pueribacillus theae]